MQRAFFLFENLFDNTPMSAISRKDRQFINQQIERLQKELQRLLPKYEEKVILCDYLQFRETAAWLIDEIQWYHNEIDNRNQQLDILKKMVKIEPITQAEQAILLRDKHFQDTIAARYAHVVSGAYTPNRSW